MFAVAMAEKTGDFSIFELAESVNTESEKKNVCLIRSVRRQTVSSLFHSARFVQRDFVAPRWPSLVGRYLGKVMVAGSKPARGSTSVFV
jgi:hypothetical protein